MIRTPPSNMRSQNLVHVSMKNEESNFSCANGSNCQRFRVKVSKKRTTLSLCPHEHVVMLVSGKNIPNAAAENSEDDDDNDDEKALSEAKEWLENSAKYLFDRYRVNFSDSNVRRLEEKVMEKNKSGGWSKLYQV